MGSHKTPCLFSISQGSERAYSIPVGAGRKPDSISWWGNLWEGMRLEILLQPFWEEAVCQCKFFFRTVIYVFVLSSGSMVQQHDRKLQVARAGGGAEQTQVQTLVTESRLEASFMPPASQSGPLSTCHSLVLVSDTTRAEHSSLPSRGSQFHGDLSLAFTHQALL